MKSKSSSLPMYIEEICIIQIQRPSRAGVYVALIFNFTVYFILIKPVLRDHFLV
jgi:hypothetical protein